MELPTGGSSRWRALLSSKVALTWAGRTLEIQVGLSRGTAQNTSKYFGPLARDERGDPELTRGGGVNLVRKSASGHARSDTQAPHVSFPVQPTLADPLTAPLEGTTVANFWDSLTAEQKQVFRAKAIKRVFAAGARLMQEGEHGDHVAVIVSGVTEIVVGDDADERVVAVRGPGQLIGERAALEVNPRSATVVARQTVVALVMRTADFAAFVSTYPAVLKTVEKQIFTRLREGGADWEGGLALDQVAPRPPLLTLTGQNCTVVRTDVVAFGAEERDAEAHKIIRREILAMTRLTLGPMWDICRWEDRGDGLLVIMPPDVPTAQVIERFASVLPPQLRRHNRTYGAPSRIQLRVAVEVGPIEDDESGVSGRSLVGVSRLLDAPAFKQAVADREAVLGVVVSPFVYETHIQPRAGALDPADFAEIPVLVKETSRSAWMQLIG